MKHCWIPEKYPHVCEQPFSQQYCNVNVPAFRTIITCEQEPHQFEHLLQWVYNPFWWSICKCEYVDLPHLKVWKKEKGKQKSLYSFLYFAKYRSPITEYCWDILYSGRPAWVRRITCMGEMVYIHTSVRLPEGKRDKYISGWWFPRALDLPKTGSS
jgi:hypothetical protein